MLNLLQRLYRTKLALLAAVFTSTGLVLLMLTQLTDSRWLGRLPVAELGSALFTTGLIALVFEYVDSVDADERARHNLRTVMREESTMLRDSVLAGLATDPDRLTRMASPETLDSIIGNCLSARIGNAELAADIYTNLRDQVANETDDRRYDAHVTMTLTPWERGPRSGLGSMFVVTTRWQYRTYSLPSVLRFSAVGNEQAYRRLVHDPASVETWLFEPTSRLTIADPDTYQLVQCSIDGQSRSIERHNVDDAQLFTVVTEQPPDRGGRGTYVSYTHRTLVTQHGHLVFVDFATTKGLRVDFTYTPECGIRHVSVLDFISSATRPRVERSPRGVPNPTVSIAFDDAWTFPRSALHSSGYLTVRSRSKTPALPGNESDQVDARHAQSTAHVGDLGLFRAAGCAFLSDDYP